jgi:hypothetical protein
VFLHKTSIAISRRFREFPSTTAGLPTDRPDAIESLTKETRRHQLSSNENKQLMTIAIVDSKIGVNNGVARFDD